MQRNKMQLSENWFVDAPWAQLLCSTKIPNDILPKFITMSDDILEKSVSLFLYVVIKSFDLELVMKCSPTSPLPPNTRIFMILKM